MPVILSQRQEEILNHLIKLKRNPQNVVYIGNQMDTYPPNIEDKELIQILKDLDANRLIHFKMNGTHKRDLYVAADVEILPSADTYFKEKKIEQKKDTREKIRTYAPITISLIALIKSFLPEITTGMKLLMRLLR